MGTRRRSVVILGMLTKMPVAGVVWQTMHYLLGFERLGYEAYYVEANRNWPLPFLHSDDDPRGWDRAAAWLGDTMRRFGLAQRWAYHPVDQPAHRHGMSVQRVAALYRDADLIINLHGGTQPLDEHSGSGRLVYLETDPVRLQVELHDNVAETYNYLEPHAAFFTFAENYGTPRCRLPVSDRFAFTTTRQPVVIDLWDGADDAPTGPYTTIGNWVQTGHDVVLAGERYTWSKHEEFRKVLSLPRRADERFELALSKLGPGFRERLLAHGWALRDAADISGDPDAYRRYVQASKGEFTVAKDQNVRLQTGWFSDRSATYLAAGRPVVTQTTGFEAVVPTGEGLFAFSGLDDAVCAIESIAADYPRHARAARKIAREYFSADVVLGAMLRELGLS